MGTSPRRYDSPQRRRQTERTRRQIAEAARVTFLRDGWAGTTINAVARRAGVSPATVYASYGSKQGLAEAVAEAVNFTAGSAELLQDLERRSATPFDDLSAMVAYDCRLYRTAGDLLFLLRSAQGQLPELEAAYAAGRSDGDERRRARFESWPAGTLREHLTTGDAVDIYAAFCHFDTYRVLRDERGWIPDRIESWWVATLAELVLSPKHRRSS